jgi:glycosyltransferase involved in cell wall biosynthesis
MLAAVATRHVSCFNRRDTVKNQIDVAILLDHFGKGGVERVACQLANGLHRRGFRVEFVVLRDEGPVRDLLDDGISVHVLKTIGGLSRGWRLLASVPSLARYLLTRKPLLFHAPGNHTHLAAGLAVRRASFDGIFVPKITNPIFKAGMKPWKRSFRRHKYRLALKPAARIIVLSEPAIARVAMIHPDFVSKAIFLHNPYVSDEMAGQNLVRDGLGTPIILSVGRLSRQKDHPTLLRAAAILTDRAWRLRICGTGPDQEALLDLARSLAIADRVEFAGFVDDMVPQYAEAAVMALSSRWEDLPATLIEAMACGCPVVSTASSGAVVELLEAVGARAPVPVGDPVALSIALREALDGQLPIVPRKVMSAYGIDTACDAHAALFSNLLGKA